MFSLMNHNWKWKKGEKKYNPKGKKIGFETVTDFLEGGEKKTKEIDLGIVTFWFCILIKKYIFCFIILSLKKKKINISILKKIL